MRARFVCVQSVALAFILALAFPRPVYADGRWRHLSAPAEPDPDKALASNAIRALAYQDRPGPGDSRLWIGTDRGLQTYNGRTWQGHTAQATGSKETSVNAVMVDGQGMVWVGTPLGLHWQTAQGQWQTLKLNMPVLALAADGKGGAYVGTEGGGVWHCNGSGCLPTVQPEVLGSGVVHALLYHNGMLWIGTEAGLVRFAPEQQTSPYRIFDAPQGHAITSLAVDPQERLWVGGDAGVWRYDLSGDEWAFFALGQVNSLTVDQGSRVWATGVNGLLMWDPRWEGRAQLPEQWKRVPVGAENLPSPNLAFAAPDGMLWVGTQNGLSGTDGSWETYLVNAPPQVQEPAQVLVNALVRDPLTGDLWVGTNKGVRHYDVRTDHWDRVWTMEDGLVSDAVRTLFLDAEVRALWVGTDSGISRYNLQTGLWDRSWTVENGLPSNEIYALMQNVHTGEMWAGSYGGVSHYDPTVRRWKRVGSAWTGSDGGQVVLCLTQDPTTGEVWAGTGTGFWQYLPEKDSWFIIQSLYEEMRQPFVHAIGWDPERQTLWVGTDDRVIRYQTEDRRAYSPTVVEGEPKGNRVSALAQDARTGEVWAGSFGGLSHYDPERNVWDRTWTTADGLSDNNVSAIVSGSKAGELWVGTGNGVSRFSLQGPLPWVRLTRALANGQDRLQGEQIKLNRIRSVDLLFEGGSFIARQGELSYGYRLNDLEKAVYWMAFDEQKLEVAYPDLKYGKYTFELWARDIDGQEYIAQPYPLVVSPWPEKIGSWFLSGGAVASLLALAVATVYLLRAYSSYAVGWGASSGQPIQQLIPLIAPLGEDVDVDRVQAALQKHQAFTTPEQVQSALDALIKWRMLHPAEKGGYRFVSPAAAWLHRLQHLRRVGTLAEAVRSRHPLYAGARTFFTLAGFQVIESNPRSFLLVPGKAHPQADYRAIYTRLIAGRSPEGDDFEEVAEAAQQEYGGEMERRLAFVVSNRRPTPGARFRLYEIRQRWGLAIVALDSELFGQVKPNMPANDILSAQIDQATGRQNLYAISGPVSDDLSFFGREPILQRLIDLVEAGQPVGIFGLRKTGKTSLIQRLQGRLSTRRVIASVDTQGTAREQGMLPLYPAIIGAFVAHIEQYRAGLARAMPPLNLWPPPRGRSLLPNIVRVFAADLAALHQRIGGDERLLLILDEVDRLLPAGEDPGYEGFATFFGQLRSANQNLKLLDLILVGVDPSVNRRDRWGDRDNELYQALREVWMPPMDEDSAREMVKSIGFQMGIQYEPEALDLVVRAGGGQPFITRQICGETIKGQLDRGTVTVTAEQARLGIEEFVYLPESYLTELWRARLDDMGRAVLLQLAQSATPVPRADLLPTNRRQEVLATLGTLEEWTLIRRLDGDGHPGGYSIGWGVLRNWIRWIELGLED